MVCVTAFVVCFFCGIVVGDKRGNRRMDLGKYMEKITCSELQHYRMNKAEWECFEQMWLTIREDCAKMIPAEYEANVKRQLEEVPYLHYMGYCGEHGYYYVEEGDYGRLNMGCLTKDEIEMRFYIMKKILREVGQQIELKKRADEQKKWMYYLDDANTRPGHLAWVKNDTYYYHTKHDSRKMWFEYMLNGLAKLFSPGLVQPVIEEYTGYMNRWFEEAHWAYDCGSGKFVEISDSLPHD